MPTKLALKPENIAQLVFFIRGEKVMLDGDRFAAMPCGASQLFQAARRGYSDNAAVAAAITRLRSRTAKTTARQAAIELIHRKRLMIGRRRDQSDSAVAARATMKD